MSDLIASQMLSVMKRIDEKLSRVLEALEGSSNTVSDTVTDDDNPFGKSMFYPQPIPNQNPGYRICPKCDRTISSSVLFSCPDSACPQNSDGILG